MKNLAPKNHWDSAYNNYQLKINEMSGPLEKWIIKAINNYKLGNKNVFEIGCFPGSYLQIFGNYGCTLNGIDNTNRTRELIKFLKEHKYKVGKILNKNLFAHKVKRKYDVVCSFGFIEHFYDWEEIIRIHSAYLKKGGYLIITMPNFSGIIQKIYHTMVDRDNLTRHNTEVMNLKKLSKFLKINGYDVLIDDPIGIFSVWHENNNLTFLENKVIKFYQNQLKFLLKNKPSVNWSPYLGILAKKD